MNTRNTSLFLPLSEKEKDFLIRSAEKTRLSISDFVLLSALALNQPINDRLPELYKEQE